ncbi:hypothetical protein [Streptomyces sp. 1222.2]|uniref:hypothetical protein n=1 Tax=Streptomyces sp. 1222.2 TaxID=1938833 RepID=UPI00117F03E1|nr:hypothetical protein [Streptomyces sp. 1222.2]
MEFWKTLFTQAAGPVLSAVILGLVAAWIARRAQLRREDWSLRHELIKQMTETASSLYNETLRYHRAVNLFAIKGNIKDTYRNQLDEQYRESRTAGEVIQDRLEAYYQSSRVRDSWHRSIDLLSMQYFVLIDNHIPESLLEKYSGDKHTGLTKDNGLKDLETLRNLYAKCRKDAAEAVLTEDLRR